MQNVLVDRLVAMGVLHIAEDEFRGNEKMGDWDWLIEGMIGEPQ